MQQIRHQIREQLSFLEERIEELGAIASTNECLAMVAPTPAHFGSDILLQDALESMRALSQLVLEQEELKCIPVNDFLQRIVAAFVQDAKAQGCELAISYYADGKITLEMAELVMGAIIAGLRVTLKNLKAHNPETRAQQHLFASGSVYVELKATRSEVHFRLMDDGLGFGLPTAADLGAEKQFQKLREYIANVGGWFGLSSLGSFGNMIEFKVPLTNSRFEVFIVREGEFEALIPASCVAEVVEKGKSPRVPPIQVYRPSELTGLARGSVDAAVLLRIGVADMQFWIGCDALVGRTQARRSSATEFVNQGSWLQSMGIFRDGVDSRALPILEGAALVRFPVPSGGKA